MLSARDRRDRISAMILGNTTQTPDDGKGWFVESLELAGASGRWLGGSRSEPSPPAPPHVRDLSGRAG